MRTTSIRLAIAAALAAVAASSAMADTIDVQINYAGLGMPIFSQAPSPTINGGETGGLMSLARTGGSTAIFTQTPATMPAGSYNFGGGVGIAAFCIDLLQNIGGGIYQFDIIPLDQAPNGAGQLDMGPAKATAIAQLWHEYINPLETAQVSGAEANFQPFQMALWEIVYETAGGAWDAATGNFTTTDGTLAASANAMFAWLAANPNAEAANLRAFSAPSGPATGDYQDLVVEVPEAANVISLAAIALAAGGFNLKRLRRRVEAQA